MVLHYNIDSFINNGIETILVFITVIRERIYTT
jgi:hypothetical protein